MFWTIALGVSILVIGVIGATVFLDGIFDSWEPIEGIAWTIGFVIWIAVFICIGIWYAQGPYDHTFPSNPHSEVEITVTS